MKITTILFILSGLIVLIAGIWVTVGPWEHRETYMDQYSGSIATRNWKLGVPVGKLDIWSPQNQDYAKVVNLYDEKNENKQQWFVCMRYTNHLLFDKVDTDNPEPGASLENIYFSITSLRRHLIKNELTVDEEKVKLVVNQRLAEVRSATASDFKRIAESCSRENMELIKPEVLKKEKYTY